MFIVSSTLYSFLGRYSSTSNCLRADRADDVKFHRSACLLEELDGALLRELLDALTDLRFIVLLHLHARTAPGRKTGKSAYELVALVADRVADTEDAPRSKATIAGVRR